ncbi:hypothetical protein [Anaerocolumna xylanovorans]|uniref:Uncharacterized protein n=1 Tax=Anaerocolumna xylanovorans DSM 12503 TaxID=1121345 RepID=A0A1M7YKW0_9FIRM|nr:hypothetical protein [Anaerocolumna xylanovorans]SHO53253.1 hypothetical protein SAMN02745217_04023 [Anaerocolumna xylanovorans DSM 12503]
MRELYDEIYAILKRVDFKRIWNGFHRYPYALYNDNTVYLRTGEVSYDPAFRGNTCILWKGDLLAIWRVDSEEKVKAEELAAEIAHEMFHAFQQEMGEERYPNDFKLLCYPLDIWNLFGKYNENLLLARSVKEKDREELRRILALIGACRRKRAFLIGDFICEEYRTETLEGMAEYTSLMVLKQIDDKLYEERLEKYRGILGECSFVQFDIRKISYITGAILMLLLSEAGIDIYHKVGKEKRTVWELAAGRLQETEVELEAYSGIEKLLTERKQRQKEQFRTFFRKSREKVTRAGIITGYDPMNMIRYKNLILCTHFVEITFEEDKNSLVIAGPVVVQLKEENGRCISCYYR